MASVVGKIDEVNEIKNFLRSMKKPFIEAKTNYGFHPKQILEDCQCTQKRQESSKTPMTKTQTEKLQ